MSIRSIRFERMLEASRELRFLSGWLDVPIDASSHDSKIVEILVVEGSAVATPFLRFDDGMIGVDPPDPLDPRSPMLEARRSGWRARGDETEWEEAAGKPGNGGSLRDRAESDPPVLQFPAASPHLLVLS
jgi:hypothetical protein